MSRPNIISVHGASDIAPTRARKAEDDEVNQDEEVNGVVDDGERPLGLFSQVD